MRKTTIQVGDSVRYRRDFLRFIGAYSGPLGWARGTVTGIQRLSEDVVLAIIAWDRPEEEVPSRVNVKNLERTRKQRN